MLSLIVAVARDNAIGKQNELLWHISADLKYFKKITTGHPVIMGRRTFESIGRPLPGRRNIVVTRREAEIPGTETVHSVPEAVEMAKNGEDEFFVIGGGQLYRQTFESADRLYITRIEAQVPAADTFFPAIDEKIWRVREESFLQYDEENRISFRFLVYEKR